MREMLKRFVCIVAVAAVGGPGFGVRADDAVQIKSGTVGVESPVSLAGGAFDIEGTQNFAYVGGAEGGTSDADCGPCLAGDTISLTTELRGTYFGTLTYRGQTYELDISNGNGRFTFASPDFVLPPAESGSVVTIEQPFSLVNTSLTLPEGDVVPVEGSGIATARFTTFQDAGETYYFLEEITFTFDN